MKNAKNKTNGALDHLANNVKATVEKVDQVAQDVTESATDAAHDVGQKTGSSVTKIGRKIKDLVK